VISTGKESQTKQALLPSNELAQRRVETFANNIVSPLSIGLVLLGGFQSLSALTKPRQNSLDALLQSDDPSDGINSFLNNANAIGDIASALGDIGRPGSLVGNLGRAVLDLGMSIPGVNVVANQLFHLLAFLIKISWATTENTQRNEERKNQKSFFGKMGVELKYSTDWVRDLFHKNKIEEWRSGFKEHGFKEFLARRTSGAIVLSAWLGAIGSLFLLGGNSKPEAHSIEEKLHHDKIEDFNHFNLLHKIGWTLVKVSLGLLTFSYLGKFLNRDYHKTNGLWTGITSGVTFFISILNMFMAHDPIKGQQVRIGFDFLSRLVSLSERITHSRSLNGLTAAQAS
jgi:hypothetical protein